MESNYRSAQTVLDAAHGIIPSPKELKSKVGGSEKPLQLISFETEDDELMFLADDIDKKIKSGIKPENIAVLYRDNKDSAVLSQILEKRGIPFSIESDEDILADNEIKKLITLIRCADNLEIGRAHV